MWYTDKSFENTDQKRRQKTFLFFEACIVDTISGFNPLIAKLLFEVVARRRDSQLPRFWNISDLCPVLRLTYLKAGI